MNKLFLSAMLFCSCSFSLAEDITSAVRSTAYTNGYSQCQTDASIISNSGYNPSLCSYYQQHCSSYSGASTNTCSVIYTGESAPSVTFVFSTNECSGNFATTTATTTIKWPKGKPHEYLCT